MVSLLPRYMILNPYCRSLTLLSVGKGKGLSLTRKDRHRQLCTASPARRSFVVLGIETSCDDTGVAIVRDDGTVLGESHFSQAKTLTERYVVEKMVHTVLTVSI